MLGVAVNAGAIVLCAIIGSLFAGKIPSRFETIVRKAIGLAIIYIGLKGAFDSKHTLLLILSLVIGGVIGEAIDIDRWMNRLGDWAGSKFKGRKSQTGTTSFSEGFVQASIIFCTGSMAIVGSMEAGFTGDYSMLFAKTILDGSISVVLAATMGIGVVFSAVPVFVYEGAIALISIFAGNYLSPEIVTEMSAVGSLSIAAIGLNFLDIAPIKVANLIPSIFVPLVYFLVLGVIK
jgi:uncharacterized membrane protein YqgA involved in biofilm formation